MVVPKRRPPNAISETCYKAHRSLTRLGSGQNLNWYVTSRCCRTAGRASCRSEGSGAFTSDLSVDEHLLVTQSGYQPVGYVMGTSIYHVGIQLAGWNQSQELQVLSQAMYNARELAIERMKVEADALHADGVVGVRLQIQMYAWGQDVLEFVAEGTAVRSVTAPGSDKLSDGSPFTSDLSDVTSMRS